MRLWPPRFPADDDSFMCRLRLMAADAMMLCLSISTSGADLLMLICLYRDARAMPANSRRLHCRRMAFKIRAPCTTSRLPLTAVWRCLPRLQASAARPLPPPAELAGLRDADMLLLPDADAATLADSQARAASMIRGRRPADMMGAAGRYYIYRFRSPDTDIATTSRERPSIS